jgi:hypothetical protein
VLDSADLRRVGREARSAYAIRATSEPVNETRIETSVA